MSLLLIRRELKKLSDPKSAKFAQGFFKTGPGQYGEGDVFMGISVPEVRAVAGTYRDLPLPDLKALLSSKLHEERLAALVIVVNRYKKTKVPAERDSLFEFYVRNRTHINNWDLVDVSAAHVVGAHLHEKEKSLLYDLAKSKRMWDRRVAIIATHFFIRANAFDDTLKIAKRFLKDEEDLMHKATGWMLREVGKRDLARLEKFLGDCYREMPRTMLRYAIEKFPETRRKAYLKGDI